MEIIKINLTSVKVILSREEINKYEFLSCSELEEAEMLDSIDKLLEKINNEANLDLKKNKLLLQVYPSKSGECEIYISCTEDKIMYREKTVQGGSKRNMPYINVYRFDTFTELVSACYRLHTITSDEGSQIYYDKEKEKYYLLCQSISSKEMRFAFLNEYAKQLKSQTTYYIKEHFECICRSNAIRSFSELA